MDRSRKIIDKPLTFRGIIKLIDTSRSPYTEALDETYNLTDGMRATFAGYDGDSRGAVSFIEVTSEFYPELSGYYRKKARRWLKDWRLEQGEEGDEEDEEDGDEEHDDEEWDPMRYSRP
jgi:hypothetical protein